MDPGRSKVDQEGKDFDLVCQFECWINIFINILICSVISRLMDMGGIFFLVSNWRKGYLDCIRDGGMGDVKIKESFSFFFGKK